MAAKKMWGGRFSEKNSDITERISMSIHYDSRLYKQDIAGSKAHAEMLMNMKILSKNEFEDICVGLDQIKDEISNGEFEFKSAYEDIHMNIEARLTEIIGDAGKKLHTARSRNDQVALDTRLYIREETENIEQLLVTFISRLTDLAELHMDVVLAGYTHLQIAQPVRLSHHLLAHAWPLLRDFKRFRFFKESHNVSPLGVGAMAGVNYKNDRDFTAKKLGFSGITSNSMDTVADRDFISDILYAAALLGVHLSRFCEELVLWSSYEFGYISLSDKVTTGSSIMPQKKNPDLAELIRGKSGRLTGNLVSLLTTMKGLPLTYNRDLQEDKEPLFDTIDTVKLSLEGMIAMFADIKFNKERMKEALYGNFCTATDVADYLAQRGVPFRNSHEIVGSIVNFCEKENRDFFSLTLDELRGFSTVFEEDVLESIDPISSTERKLSAGSTAAGEVEKQINSLREQIDEIS